MMPGAACKENGKKIEVKHRTAAYEIVDDVFHRDLLDIEGRRN